MTRSIALRLLHAALPMVLAPAAVAAQSDPRRRQRRPRFAWRPHRSRPHPPAWTR